MPKAKSSQPELIATKKASMVGTSEPKFLWYPFLPYKKLTVVQGESGMGKSSLILNIAALLSRGSSMPFVQNDQSADYGEILYFCKEDDEKETINPRLINIGADLERVHFLNENYYFDDECKRLEATIRNLNARLVVIDPLISFLGRSYSMNTAQSVGNLMRELSRVAAATDSVIVVICHLSKNSSAKEIDRHLGSSDIINAARSVLSVTREDEEIDIMTVKHLKSTLTKRAAPFYFEIVGNGVIEFMNGTWTNDMATPGKKENKIDIAKTVLQQILSNGARSQPEIKDMFDDMEICSWRTVETAKSELGIEQYWDGDISYWELER